VTVEDFVALSVSLVVGMYVLYSLFWAERL
jgi:hypothetical protein